MAIVTHRLVYIGPTMGFVAMEEGFCSFSHVKLPRTALLARYGSVSRSTITV